MLSSWTIENPGVTGIDPQIAVDMIEKRAWLPLGALGVGLVMRLLKTDIKIFPSIDNPRFRIWACFALGQAAGTLEAVIAGKTYKEAIIWGLTQSVLAIIGHNAIIESIRGGKEFVVPGLTKPGVAPSPGSPPSIPASGGTSPVPLSAGQAAIEEESGTISIDIDTPPKTPKAGK